MTYTYNVITPLNRFDNLRPLIASLAPQGIQWHVIMDDDLPFRVQFKQEWVHEYVCPNRHQTFWDRCNFAINWFLNSYPLIYD